MIESPIHIRLKQQHFESDQQQAMLSLLVAAEIIKKKQIEVCSTKNITHSQYNILRILKGCHPEGYCRKDIIERMLEKAPDVTRLINGLVQAEYAERDAGLVDKRMSLTKITQKGLDLLDELHEPMQAYSKELHTLFSKEDLTRIIELCGKIISHDLESQNKGMQS